MTPHLALVDGIDPKLTENYLLAQPGVEDASVWYARGKLKAQVCVVETNEVDPNRLIESCGLLLGDNQAPTEIELLRVRPRAA